MMLSPPTSAHAEFIQRRAFGFRWNFLLKWRYLMDEDRYYNLGSHDKAV
ncbi:MAG: hypothetical protein IPG22_06375 [Acidobacteria bacterium]|nr:hypothetical protein [Acidobacteriota bacterium]